jgi:hypothetical protein
VINEAIGIPPHLSLSNGVCLVVDPPWTQQRPGTIDREPENDDVFRRKPRRRKGSPGTRRSRVDHSRGLADFHADGEDDGVSCAQDRALLLRSNMSIHGMTAMYLPTSLSPFALAEARFQSRGWRRPLRRRNLQPARRAASARIRECLATATGRPRSRASRIRPRRLFRGTARAQDPT